MTLTRFALSLLAASLIAPWALAADPCNDACQTLLSEGHTLQAQGQFPQAYEKFKAAATASPQASIPVSSVAGLMFSMSRGAKPEDAVKLRSSARTIAMQALQLAPLDPVALEVLRELDDDGPSPLHTPTPAAAALRNQAEVLFGQHRYPDALAKYEAAMAADPKYSMAWVGAGDTWFMQRDWVHAEALFRRATEIEPNNAQAWRFLADALVAQNKRDAGEAALIGGIGADPSQRPDWTKLASIRAGIGMPLKSLQLRRGGRVTQDPDGKFTVAIDDWVMATPQSPDTGLRITLAITEAADRRDNADKKNAKPLSPWDIELHAWRTALKVVDELHEKDGKPLTDPALLQMQAMARDGQLEPALLLLQFRQAYRPALEAWSEAHPNGVKTFIDRYGLAP